MSKKDQDPTINVKLFASSKELVGKDNIRLRITDQITTAHDLRKMILELYPSFSTKSPFAIAVNHKVASDTTTISYLDEVAILPQISGG